MVVLEIKKGTIRGKVCTDSEGGKFYSFQNIPYAAPPVGDLRFKAPQPVEPWTGIKDATKEGNESISYHLFTRKYVGSEDCLNLNVYTSEIPKNDNSSTLKPVMFWIHGGVFTKGSNKTELFGPEFLMREDVVLVTINYRLGILGFLSLDDPSLGIPGNAGFKDMVLALKWVRDNIMYFSGDRNNVTVFGESAGAAAAHLLMLSPMAKGLFHRVIAQSASALNTWIYGKRSGRQLAKELRFPSSNDKKILEFLRNASSRDILRAQLKIDSDDFAENDFRVLGFVVERPNEEAFLTEWPVDVIASGNYSHVPLMMGYNLREGMAFNDIAPQRAREPFFKNMELSVPLTLRIQRGSAPSRIIADKIQHFYFGDVEPNRKQHLMHYADLCTDTCFLRDVYFSVKYHIKSSIKPIYFYRISLETELNLFKKLTRSTLPGVYHGDDIGYLFKTMFTPEIEPGSIEDVAQRRITKLWANFARYGNPTPNANDHCLKVKWKPCDTKSVYFLDIGEKLRMDANPEAQRMAFWTDIFKLNPTVSKL